MGKEIEGTFPSVVRAWSMGGKVHKRLQQVATNYFYPSTRRRDGSAKKAVACVLRYLIIYTLSMFLLKELVVL